MSEEKRDVKIETETWLIVKIETETEKKWGKWF